MEFHRLTSKRMDDLFKELDSYSDVMLELLESKKGKYKRNIQEELTVFHENKVIVGVGLLFLDS